MGFDSDCCKYVEQKTDSILSAATFTPHTNRVVFEDCLTRLFQAKGPRHDHTFTGIELFETFMRPADQALRHSTAQIYIITVDDARGVPKEKSMTQAARSAAASQKDILPYPATYQFHDEGIVDSAQENAPIELIDIRRLLRTRSMRMSLWRFMDELIQRKVLIPEKKMLIFNFDRDGPTVYTNRQCHIEPNWKHSLGEADLSAPFFYWLFRSSPIYVVSTDSDFLAIGLSYLYSTPKEHHPPELIWERRRTKQPEPERVDLIKLYHALPEATGLSIPQFLLVCILSGSDYNKKKPVAHMFNSISLFDAMKKLKPEINEDGITLADLILFNRQLFTNKLGVTHNEIKASQRKVGTKRKQDDCKADNDDEDEDEGKQQPPQKQQKLLSTSTDTDEEKNDIPKLYNQACNGLYTLKQIEHKMKNGALGRHLIPSNQELHDRLSMINFNLVYWLESWKSYTHLQDWNKLRESSVFVNANIV